MTHIMVVLLGIFFVTVAASRAGAAEPGAVENVRALPYPFSHVVSFASDVDMQRPWHGAAIHRILNEQIGLTISDSLWPQGSAYSSVFFLGYNTLNRTPSLVGTHPVYALLLREWHRGNIDHFHGWQEDGVLQVRNEVTPPLKLMGARTTLMIPPVSPHVLAQKAQNIRLYFSSEPPADLAVTLLGNNSTSLAFSGDAIARGTKIQLQVGSYGWIVELIVPAPPPGALASAFDLMQLSQINLTSPSCTVRCDVALTRIERDHFSRQTVQSQSRWLALWNVRPALLTSHGGNSLVQDYGIEGKALDLPRTTGTFLADSTAVVKREGLANRRESHAFHTDILKSLSVKGVWSYFAADGSHLFRPLVTEKDKIRVPPLTTSYAGLYNVPRSTMTTNDTNREKFVSSLAKQSPGLSLETIHSLYCGADCNASQGDALALLISQSLHLIDRHETIKHFWYTHFGSGGSAYKPSMEEPVTPIVLNYVRQLANHVYNFDGRVTEERRVWVPPANSWLLYQILQQGLNGRIMIGESGSAVEITPWEDPVTQVRVPDLAAGTRDLHGLTIYVANSATAHIKVGNSIVETFTRNPADGSGRQSITIVDNNTPTVMLGGIALRERGDVIVEAGSFSDASQENAHITLVPDQDGRASVTFRPWLLDLWNTSHLHVALRRRLTMNSGGQPKGFVRLDITMDDGGVVAIAGPGESREALASTSSWRIADTPPLSDWHRSTLDVAQLTWPARDVDYRHWRRPALPLGRVRSIQIRLIGAGPGESLEIADLRALRPSGNGEAPDGTKLVAGRVTADGMLPLANISVHAATAQGQRYQTSTDQDGYYFFYNFKRDQRVTIDARVGSSPCHPRQGRVHLVQKNDAEIDIYTGLCRSRDKSK